MTTSRSLERRGAFTLACVAALIILGADRLAGVGTRRAAAAAEAERAGRIVPAWLFQQRRILCPLAGRAGCNPEISERQIAVGMDGERLLLPAQRQRTLMGAPQMTNAHSQTRAPIGPNLEDYSMLEDGVVVESVRSKS